MTTTIHATPLLNDLSNLLTAISNPNALLLFELVASKQELHSTNLSRKQFYSNLHKLKQLNLITSYTPYKLTIYGQIVYHIIDNIKKVMVYSPRLRVIDVLNNCGLYDYKPSNKHLEPEKLSSIIDALIDDPVVKSLININI